MTQIGMDLRFTGKSSNAKMVLLKTVSLPEGTASRLQLEGGFFVSFGGPTAGTEAFDILCRTPFVLGTIKRIGGKST